MSHNYKVLDNSLGVMIYYTADTYLIRDYITRGKIWDDEFTELFEVHLKQFSTYYIHTAGDQGRYDKNDTWYKNKWLDTIYYKLDDKRGRQNYNTSIYLFDTIETQHDTSKLEIQSTYGGFFARKSCAVYNLPNNCMFIASKDLYFSKKPAYKWNIDVSSGSKDTYKKLYKDLKIEGVKNEI
jgi:hypothetical protein|tara:strand:+ start:1737 stop:2282 length:546 start_codon:yes stop_codon:yes gene_type:complete